ncbi:glycoside hydrolase family 97 protein [Saccharopolyspora taberi]|uniref:Glycoside hydrolase family 97 protein n=1 Tax=Saccharopolyspora taberi TaxID=60895 RepID=A0ABN3VGV0_9PSEU
MLKPPSPGRAGLLVLLVLALAAITLPASAAQTDPVNPASPYSVSSPDGQIEVGFALKSGKPFYNVSHHGKPFLLDSSLGMQFKDAPALDDDFEVTSVHRDTQDSTWKLQWGERKEIRNHYNELTIDLREKSAPGRQLQVVFRVFDDGVGFRYVLPRQDAMNEFAMTEEDTEFRFAGNFTAHSIPADYGPGIGDEHLWRTTPLSRVDAANTPLTIETPDRGFATLHEANLVDYASMTAASTKDGSPSLRSALVPMPDGVKVRGTAPHSSPWRTLTITDTAPQLMESNLVLNLNDPCQICGGDTSWIKPGKYVGVWWEIHKGLSTWTEGPKHGATTENAKRFIDFAAAHKIPYVMTEGWDKNWEEQPPGSYLTSNAASDFDPKEVIRYAESKGVKWEAHNETFGDVSNYDRQIDDVYAEYERLGIPAVKTGYAGDTKIDGQPHPHYDQTMINRYREHIKKAADHHLMVEAHEIVKDTGERRTFPNFMTREAVRGQEYEAWSEGNPPKHTVDIPFTRMMAGPVSYTPGIFNIKWDPPGPGVPWATMEPTRVHTTRAKQLAMYPVYLSGLQMLADLPEHYEGKPEFAFLEEVPTTWDDTKAINAKIGEYVTMARKSGAAWYVGSMTNEQARSLPVPLQFLDPGTTYTATVYGDAPGTDLENNPDQVEIKRVLVKSTDSLIARMAASGGQAVKLEPASKTDLETLPNCSQDTSVCQ